MFQPRPIFFLQLKRTIRKIWGNSYLSECYFSNRIHQLPNCRNMPKDKANIAALKEIRMKNKNSFKKSRFPPGEMYICILGNGAAASSRALYLFTDHERYLFNCGEGTQRLSQEHKMKLAKLNHIFITHKSWENLGGLLGLSLTIQDMGVPEITLHGPPNIDLLYKHSSAFVILKDLNIVTKNLDESFHDDCMDIQYIPIYKSYSEISELASSSSSEEYQSIDSSDDESTKHKSKKLRLSVEDVTVAFACKGHTRPGHLLLDKCADVGVPVGPLLGDLKNGKDVTLPSGKIVLSKDVVSPAEVCPIFLVVECPSEEFLTPFVTEEKFHQYQEHSPDVASLVIHFTPSEILKSAKYQEWMQRFPATTCHLILNADSPSLNSLAVNRIQHQLNLLHPGIFTLLQEHEGCKIDSGSLTNNVFQASTLERYNLRPATGLDRSTAVHFEPKDFVEEAMKTDGFADSLQELKQHIQQHSATNSDELFPEVAFLGTGSSIPCKVRNVSAILVSTEENKHMLMDCGEGTYGQLLRLYGNETENILLHLFCVFISHIHADHHLGLVKLLTERRKIFNKAMKSYKPLLLIGPRRLSPWLNNFCRNFKCSTSLYKFIECSTLEHDDLFNSHLKCKLENCPDISISTVPVNHCPDAHAVIVSSKFPKWKLVYSGDTVPCKRLVLAGKNCSLLIHEATMEDELATEAAIKKHSTTSEAIQIAEDMEAEYAILTHFSQRYAKVPIFNENFHNRIGCAFDNMRVRPNNLHVLPLLMPALNTLFAEIVEELHVRGHKRRQKAELMKAMTDSIAKQNQEVAT